MRTKLCPLTFILLTGCAPLFPDAPADEDLLDGPLPGLSPAQHQQFLRGDIAFNDDIFTAATGLGPVFVASSCGACHAGDGKGHPANTLIRFGQSDSSGNQYEQLGGPQLQHRSLLGFEAESIPTGAPHTALIAPSVTGLGLLDAISDSDILAWADPHDTDGDGISGAVSRVTVPLYTSLRPDAIPLNGGTRYIGRFGKKAAAYDLLHQTAGAYNQDMGVVSAFEPVDPATGQHQEPEVSSATVNDVVFYLKTLKNPPRRNKDSEAVKRGEQVFIQLGCENCHRSSFTTGASELSALSNREIHPYSDLLLHDMGAELNDGYTEGSAAPAEWRTPPLWGLGLSANSQGQQVFLLHDGRAHSIAEAIEWHGGEAEKAANAYRALSEAEKTELLEFLESL